MTDYIPQAENTAPISVIAPNTASVIRIGWSSNVIRSLPIGGPHG